MKSIFLPGLGLLLSLTSTTLAHDKHEPGRMWTFENPPLAYLEKQYAFEPDQAWLDALRLGSLRIGGKDVLTHCYSASFVSPNGLIMTSTRCLRHAVPETLGRGSAARAQSPLENIKAGFVAAGPDHEVRLRSRDGWLTAAQLIKITNVTDDVNLGVVPTDNEIQSWEKRDENKKAILAAARKVESKLVPKIVSLYQGAVFQLHQYKLFNDVRLVVVPHLQTAHFGGDQDNFTYPRYTIDFAFLRAYEDGKPVDTTKNYFKWRSGGAKKDELVFVAGNPGTTNRLFTKAQLEFERDIRIPMKVEMLANRLRILTEKRPPFGPDDPSWQYGWSRMLVLELENDLKAARGRLQGLREAKLMAQKTAAEKAFQDRVLADESLAKQYGDLWDRIDKLVKERRVHEGRARFHVPNHHLLHTAVAIVRSSDPAESNEHRELARKTVERWEGVTSPVVHYPWSAFALDQFGRARNWLPKDDPFLTKVLGGKSPEEFFELMEGEQARSSPNWLGYPKARKTLVKAGWKAIQKSEDPLVVAARELAILIGKNEKRGRELDAKEEALGAEIGRALLACYGRTISPDGTGTLRFTDGVVSGTTAPYRTTFHGLYARHAKFGGKYPFNMPKIWLDRRDKIVSTKSVNFVSTNDVASGMMTFGSNRFGTHNWRNSGGSSGSVVVNKELEVVGLIIDRNIESLYNDFVFQDDLPRAVSVHVDGIMEALVKIYGAHRFAKELIGK